MQRSCAKISTNKQIQSCTMNLLTLRKCCNRDICNINILVLQWNGTGKHEKCLLGVQIKNDEKCKKTIRERM